MTNVSYELPVFDGIFPHCNLSEGELTTEILKKVNQPPTSGFPFGRRKRNGEMLPNPVKGTSDGRRFIQIEVDPVNWVGFLKGRRVAVRQMYLDVELTADRVIVVDSFPVY